MIALCFLSKMSCVRMQGGGVYISTLAVSLEVNNVSFARISMYSNGVLASAGAGGINIFGNVTARMQARVLTVPD